MLLTGSTNSAWTTKSAISTSGATPRACSACEAAALGSVRVPGVLVGRAGDDVVRKRGRGERLDRHRLEHGAETAPRSHPHGLQDRGRLVVRDALGAHAVDAEEWTVDGPDDVGDRHVAGVGGHPPSTRLTTLAGDDAGTAQVRKDRLQESARDVLAGDDLLGGDDEIGR